MRAALFPRARTCYPDHSSRLASLTERLVFVFKSQFSNCFWSADHDDFIAAGRTKAVWYWIRAVSEERLR
jgi:hypothetical protein